MGREWAISDDDYKKILYHLHQVDEILDRNRMRDELLRVKGMLDKARLRDPRFKGKKKYRSRAMTREWAISDDDYKKVLFHIREIDEILEKNRMRDKILKVNSILGKARLRDPSFKK